MTKAIHAAKEELWQEQKLALYNWKLRNPPPPPNAWQLARIKLAQAAREYPGRWAADGTCLEEPFSLEPQDGSNIRKIFWQLCLYFAKDSRCQWDLEKGILFQGNVGRGKTTLLMLFQGNAAQPYNVEEAVDIAALYASKGELGLAPLMQAAASKGLGIDDLGIERSQRFMGGEPTNVLERVLLARYSMYQKGRLQGRDTHITTNLPIYPPIWKAGEEVPVEYQPGEPGTVKRLINGQEVPSLLLLYGNRVVDRFKQMFNQVVVNGPKSLRK